MSHPAESRSGTPAMLKDKDFQWEDPLDLESGLTEEGWCETPRAASRRTI